MLGHTASHRPTTPTYHPPSGHPAPTPLAYSPTRTFTLYQSHPNSLTFGHTHKLPWVTPSHNTKTHVSPAPGSSKHLEHIPVSHSHVSPAPFPTIEVQAMDGGIFRS